MKDRIDHQLYEYCAAQIAAAQQVNERYAVLWRALQKLMQTGGKRIRPRLVVAAYQAYSHSDNFEPILPVAVAHELLHLAMLVHDDIIDRDTIRYGIKNVTGHYDDAYEPHLADASERRHMAQSAAILAGDALLTDAYRMMSTLDLPRERAGAAMAHFSKGTFEVIGGELLDTEHAFINNTSLSAETIARYKTTSYSFISPLTVGAAAAGASDDQIRLLRQLAVDLGFAYQLRDDLLGVFGTSEKTGKSTSGDIIEGKRTVLIEQFEQLAGVAQKAEFFAIFHHADATKAQLQQARALLIESGAQAKVEALIKTHWHQANTLVNRLDINQESKAALHDLVHECLKRDA